MKFTDLSTLVINPILLAYWGLTRQESFDFSSLAYGFVWGAVFVSWVLYHYERR